MENCFEGGISACVASEEQQLNTEVRVLWLRNFRKL